MLSNDPETAINQLHEDLLAARKARDASASKLLQSIIAAIDNAGAVPVPTNVVSTELPRRELSTQDIKQLLQREMAEMQQAITELGEASGPHKEELNKKILLLRRYL